MFKLPNNHPIILSMSKKIIILFILFFFDNNIDVNSKEEYFDMLKNFNPAKIDYAKKHLDFLFKCGADLVDIGGESTRPGSQPVSLKVEWDRIKDILKKIDKKKFIT